MKRLMRCFVAVVIGAAGLIGAHQQPAGAAAQAVLVGGGWMANASGPSTTGSPVSGTISWTIVGTFGSCGGSTSFNGIESIIQGQGGGGPFGCWPDSCGIAYQRVVHEIVMNVHCSWTGTFQLAGFAEPDSALPTTGFNFQVAGVSTVWGAMAVNGNMSFTPGIGVGVDPGTLLPTGTPITFTGSLTGVFTAIGYIGSCNLTMTGAGNESFLLGTGTTLFGTCTGPFFTESCVLNLVRLATHTMITGNCSGLFGVTLFGMGELLLGAGGGYTLVAEITVI